MTTSNIYQIEVNFSDYVFGYWGYKTGKNKSQLLLEKFPSFFDNKQEALQIYSDVTQELMKEENRKIQVNFVRSEAKNDALGKNFHAGTEVILSKVIKF